MTIRSSTAWNRAGSLAQVSLGKTCRRSKATIPAAARLPVSTPVSSGKPLILTPASFLVPEQEIRKKRPVDKELLNSVFESSPTRRDARQYLQDFGPIVARQPQQKPPVPAADAGSPAPQPGSEIENGIPQVALIKLREPQSISDSVFTALGKTLAQLRALGMPGVVVVDCDGDAVPREEWWSTLVAQAERVAKATGSADTKVADSIMGIDPVWEKSASRFSAGGVFVASGELLLRPLREGSLVVVPAYATAPDTFTARPVSSNQLILALARFLAGTQFPGIGDKTAAEVSPPSEVAAKASIARVIVIDPLGGPPARNRPNGAHMFLNMVEEFETVLEDIDQATYPESKTNRPGTSRPVSRDFIKKKHTENLELTKLILTMLPSTSSVMITTPEEAANLATPSSKPRNQDNNGTSWVASSFLGTTGTRRARNPLIHNLLTDRPVHSSSLPLGCITAAVPGRPDSEPVALSRTTLAKRGMPLTVIPDPRTTPWVPPEPGGPRLRLTDMCVDLPRLVHLIDDSFGRRLDVQHYLDRVSESMAGIIIAGEYEGGAILTWERPFGLSEGEAYGQGRMVPYLDKFAVLRKSQGAGGVADIVFNAMVRGCFPEGVCWRSRRDNPVNKWYFERSRGYTKLHDSNWTMFWTTMASEDTLRDYEDVCRNVQPSWADKKHIVD